ncbi:hypothetical protein [Plantactinospora sp. KBS50]|nr:hypothetical protein [Plantactinospora sp. KBS50]
MTLPSLHVSDRYWRSDLMPSYWSLLQVSPFAWAMVGVRAGP